LQLQSTPFAAQQAPPAVAAAAAAAAAVKLLQPASVSAFAFCSAAAVAAAAAVVPLSGLPAAWPSPLLALVAAEQESPCKGIDVDRQIMCVLLR